MTEAPLRSLALVWALVLAHAPLVVFAGADGAPEVRWFTGPFLLALLVVGAAQALRREASEEPSALSLRLERYAPMAVGMTLAGALAFPSLTTWRFLWFLGLLQLPLLTCWNLARPRTISLWVASLAALGATVVLDAAAFGLAGPAMAWVVIPALEAGAAERARAGRVAPAWRPWLGGVLGASGLGVLLFAAALAILPPTHRSLPTDSGGRMLDSGEPRPAAEPPPLPVAEVFTLLGLFAALWALSHLVFGRAGGGVLQAPESRGMQVDEAYELPALPNTGAAPWPDGPRRALVERYVEHVAALRQALGDAPGRTAPGWAAALDAVAGDPALRAAAEDLAARFDAARYGRAPVDAAVVDEARGLAERLDGWVRQTAASRSDTPSDR